MNKNLNKGVSVVGIIISLLIVGFIAGGLYFYLNSQMPKVETPNGEAAQETVNNEASTSVPAKKDCGTINMRVALTDETKAAMDCINNSIINCDLAVVKLMGTGVSTYEIFGKDNNDCVIEQKIITPAPKSDYPTFEYYFICKFPMDTFIGALVQKQGASSDFLFMGLSFIKGIDNAQIGSDGWYPNEVSGLMSGQNTLYKCK